MNSKYEVLLSWIDNNFTEIVTENAINELSDKQLMVINQLLSTKKSRGVGSDKMLEENFEKGKSKSKIFDD